MVQNICTCGCTVQRFLLRSLDSVISTMYAYPKLAVTKSLDNIVFFTVVCIGNHMRPSTIKD